MRNTTFILVLLASVLCAHAETLLLRTGARVQGTIVFQNEEVIVIRNAEGARFQYPRGDVEQVLADEEEAAPASVESGAQEAAVPPDKKASILLEIAGGYACVSSESAGVAFSADVLAGSHHIGNRHVFAGGGLGYHGVYLADPAALSDGKTFANYNFLPIQAAVRMPFTEKKHAPAFGISLGYGIALSKDYTGGVYAGADFGYRCQVNPKTAVGLVLYTQYQQARIRVTETVEGERFTNYAGRNIVCAGIKLSLYF